MARPAAPAPVGPVLVRPLLLLPLLLQSLSLLAASGLAPLGPRTLGVLEGFSSTSPYANPASRSDAFGEWLGWRPQWANQCLDFSQWSTWPGFFIDPFNFNATDARLTLQMPAMFHSQSTNTTWWDAAAGAYDEQWRQTADVACNVFHKCDIAMRPAWEMNGNWYPWSAGQNVSAYVSYFRHLVRAVRSANNSRPLIIWNANAMYQAGTPDTLNPPWLAYPGDDYVDAIGVDLYDQDWTAYPPGWQANLTRPQVERVWEAQWLRYRDGLYGLNDFLRFALAHRKPLAVSEWGLKPVADHGGGDNVVYVRGMYEWLTNATTYPSILYQAWYDEEDSTISRAPLNPNNTNFPNAAALYRTLFGPNNTKWAQLEQLTAPVQQQQRRGDGSASRDE